MIRHPRYLEIPWNARWHQEDAGPRRHLALLVVALVLLAVVCIGVGVTSGIL